MCLEAPVIEKWHKILSEADAEGLAELIADDAVFYSPVIYSPQKGKELVVLYLSAAFLLLFNERFRYVHEWKTCQSAVLEFETEVEGIYINGIDIITWNEDDQIVSFKVMIRPIKAVDLVKQKMIEMMQSGIGGIKLES